MQWHRTVSFRVIAGSLALLLLSFALYAYLTIRFYDERMMAQARDGAQRRLRASRRQEWSSAGS